ncbi:ATP phosphoribosyltransferase regulatory subunit [Candidatus Rhodobacter oscarellae]|uniref:ATP phosphoribosyltransferase regulatory subunit n=1 Tax=Candidatus Rhodobacter oscarellae TaxID=1675527 RepID=A0A0J9EB80_9RHOB|nr:ATP phosphoribosyltransferase regulatory subunit [Candidatus Rhodobacter lobularis]KMW60027.1 ATP phosphoribosyltransferase regulatory subunit [Candidatus Rhodobacter lobularis]
MTTTPEQEAARCLAAFERAGGRVVDLPILQPAERLLDLYGEDIRARAYTTRDPVAGELMLRPDFTVPVVDMHLARGAAEARYAYAGKVFRVQEPGSDRPSEYDQVGFESFGVADRAAADAEVFGLFSEVLAGLPLRVATGDIGVLIAAIGGLSTSARRKAALLRHIWRPGRFRRLLDRFSGRAAMPSHRDSLLAKAAAGEDILADAGPMIGLRSEAEIWARVEALAADAREAPIPAQEAGVIDKILALRAAAPEALTQLRALSADLPTLAPAADLFEARLEALGDVSGLMFEGSYGRTNMEYYDGFVFGFYADAGPEVPPVATGGRYDALTRAVGRDMPAVGGMIRPALTAGARG